MTIELIMTQDIEEVRRLVSAGYCPVECSIGAQSIVDDLQMDHHGELSHLESVAVRAWRDHFGARRADPRFVGVGFADADMSFAVAALAGLLPRNRDTEIAALAELIAQVDSEPIGADIARHPQGGLLLLWSALAGGASTSLRSTSAVHLWHSLLTSPPARLTPFREVAIRGIKERQAQATEDMRTRALRLGSALAIDGSQVWGFDVWYQRRVAAAAETPQGWAHPVVIARSASDSQITVGCPNKQVAEALFGPGGLRNVFGQLIPAGWGGREAVGGSPRGMKMTHEQLLFALKQIKALMAV